ncbi:MAG: tRNA dihydrouridine synthase DusB, partial [Chlamydiia bacterium]|nr:tRNA dihydrouridine synthase DusB [Chlamydiia bacterium]
VFYSPLAGCSDYPFRRMSALYGPGLQYCEMVKMDALVRNDSNTFHILDYSPDMHPIGAQLVGSKVGIAGQAAKILEDLGFDVIDLTCGCPVDKVTKDGSGSGLLKDPRRIGDLLAEIVAAVDIPVTVKIRAGWDEDNIFAEEITRIAEEAGADAIAIHGRTRKQAYRGPANWDYIKRAKQAARTIKVIGNGDVFDAEAAERMWIETGCDAVLCSRGTMGAPWLCDDIYRHFDGLPPLERDLRFCLDQLIEHFRFAQAYHSERKAVIDMRRVACWYIKKAAGTRDFRGAISRAQTIADVEALIRDFPVELEVG